MSFLVRRAEVSMILKRNLRDGNPQSHAAGCRRIHSAQGEGCSCGAVAEGAVRRRIFEALADLETFGHILTDNATPFNETTP